MTNTVYSTVEQLKTSKVRGFSISERKACAYDVKGCTTVVISLVQINVRQFVGLKCVNILLSCRPMNSGKNCIRYIHRSR